MLNEHPEPMGIGEQEYYGDEYKLLWLGELTARVIHELRNPLTVLSLSLSSIEREASQHPEIQQTLASAIGSVERMTNIVNSTLNFVRAENMEFEKLDLRSLVKETMPLLNSSMHKKRISIATSFDENPIPLILGHHSQLQQVLINLVDNSIDAITGEGLVTITVKASRDEQTVHLEVSDTGVGIDEHDLHKIFSPFFTRKKNGTGLGLAITKSILDRHHATAQVISTPGTGTTFTISFPAVEL